MNCGGNEKNRYSPTRSRAAGSGQLVGADWKPRRMAEKRHGQIFTAERAVTVQENDFAAFQCGKNWDAAERMIVGGQQPKLFCLQRVVEQLPNPRLLLFHDDHVHRFPVPAQQMAAHFPTAEMSAEEDDATTLIEEFPEHRLAFVATIHPRAAHDQREPIQQCHTIRVEVAIDEPEAFPQRLRSKGAAQELHRTAPGKRAGDEEVSRHWRQPRVGRAQPEQANQLHEPPVAEVAAPRASGPANGRERGCPGRSELPGLAGG